MVNKMLIILGFIFFLFLQNTHALEPIQVYAGLLNLPSSQSDKNSEIEFTALRRIFDIQGIPYRELDNPSNIFKYQTIFTSGSLLDKDTTPEIINLLYDYVESGGALFSAGHIGKRLYSLFGVNKYFPSRTRYRLHFTPKIAALKYINRPEELTISLGNGQGHFFDKVIWTHGYQQARGSQQLGEFDDGRGAFFYHQYGRGSSYLLGLTYIDSVMRPQIGKDYEAQRKYVNAFEPSADVIMLILKGVYEAHTRPYVILSTIPFGRPTALIISHDVDAQTAFIDSLKYSKLEEKYGTTSTFFINTKTFEDAADIDYYNIPENLHSIKILKKEGWDIGSHSVSHAKNFGNLPAGEPNITIADYHPKQNKTIYGEVMISKQLLDRDNPQQVTTIFRAGDLAFPTRLIGILEKSGYLYDSTFSANDVLSAFAYFAFKDRLIGSEETNIIEIPVTLDDALSFLTPKTIKNVVKTWKNVVTANMENGGITVLLIHPSDTREQDYKLRAQEAMMKFARKKKIWMGNLTEYGEFYRHRQQTTVKLFKSANKNISIQINQKEPDPMISFIIGNVSVDSSQISIEEKSMIPIQYQIFKEGNIYKVTSKRPIQN